MLRRQWQADEPSYLRNYLDNGLWGKDTLWDGLVRHAFIVFICLYLLPAELAEQADAAACARKTSCRRLDVLPEMPAIRAGTGC